MVIKMLEKIVIYSKIIVAFVLALACIFPFLFDNPYSMRIATISLTFVMITLSLNIVTGYMGQTSFGTAAFWGLGAYTGAILTTRYGVGIEITFVLAAIVAGIFGLLVGMPALKLKGYYLSIVTLGFCEIIRLVELNWVSLTGGPLGIMNIPKLKLFGFKFTDNRSIYFLMLIMVIVTTILVYRLVNSAFGLVLTSIKDDEIATQAMGINIVEYKIKAFVIHAMICGVAGAFYAQYISYIDSTMFTTNQSIEMMVMAIVGGMGSIAGSFIGAIVLSVLPEIMRSLMEYRMLLYGLIMVIMMIVKPEGLFGNVNFVHIKQRLDAKNAIGEAKKI